jgi:hypothetical protein
MMLDPVTNLLAGQAAKRASDARRPLAERARAAAEPGRSHASDTFEHAPEAVEPASPVRPLADADQQDAVDDRQARQGGPEGHGPGREAGSLDLTA